LKTDGRWWFFALLVCGIIALADLGRLSWVTNLLRDNPGSDKVAHFFLIGTLAFLLNNALRGRMLGVFMLGSLLVGVVLTCEEISQRWVKGRNFDYGDMAANLAGCAAADLIARRKRVGG
jgi:polysaccharide biosynthesis protein VpsQ